ncbi:unnamed protein product [Mytilus coruscus]|uniref:TRIM2_3 n=1 Tax=Mytilus coruscus TaxID=42192 RepID=A0A6J8D690_MYTCO|nr:unnamed protein product [Mytilus coruscus]
MEELEKNPETILEQIDDCRDKINKCVPHPPLRQENISTIRETFTQAQTPVPCNLPVSVTLRQKVNIEWPEKIDREFLNCIKLGNKLVLLASNTRFLNICNVDGTDAHHIPLPYTPWYITEVDHNTLAVSCTRDKVILIIDISTGYVTGTIKLRNYCYGISYDNEYLYVVIDRKIIHVMNMTGNLIRTITSPSVSSIDITVHKDRYVCINLSSINCYYLDGKLKWKFENGKFENNFHSVTVDEKGNVYVTDRTSDTIVAVSADGRNSSEILSATDGLLSPSGIHYDRDENILLVCNFWAHTVFLFDVKW